MITYNFQVEDIKEHQKGDLPEQAIKLDTPPTMDEAMKKRIPIMIATCILLNIILFYEVAYRDLPFQLIAMIPGVVIGWILLIVHELLHAIVYPKEARVTVGKLKGKFLFVALASYPMKRFRFILMCLLPYVLGVIPLLLFISHVFDNPIMNGIIFGISIIGMLSPSLDVCNVIVVLKQSNQSNFIMFYEDDLYKF